MDILQIVSKGICTSVWSNNINMIRYLKNYIIYTCKVDEKYVSRICSNGLILDTLIIKQNKFRSIVEEIRKLGWELKSHNDGIYTFEKEN